MKIMNPNFVQPADAAAAALKTKLSAWFAANPTVQFVTLEQVQARFPADAAGMAAGALHQAARDAGWTVKADE